MMVGSNGSGTLTAERPAEARRRSGPPVSATPSGLVRRRRWGIALGGVGAIVLGGWGFASLWLAAGDRVEVVALAGDVQAYEQIDWDDLRTVRVAAPDGVDVVRANELDDVVGRVATSDLPDRSLLVEADLFPADEKLVSESEAVVGVRVAAGAAPVELARGRAVLAVIRPTQTARGGTGEDGQARSVEGWILQAEAVESGAGQATGGLSVSVVVPRDEATEVADAAADDRLSLVALEE
jgi:hypothetical protein